MAACESHRARYLPGRRETIVSAAKISDEEAVQRYVAGEPVRTLYHAVSPKRLARLLTTRGVLRRRGTWCELQCRMCSARFGRRISTERLRIRRGQIGPFCSISCTQTWRHSEGRLHRVQGGQQRVAPETVVCERCSVVFRPRHNGQRFCSIRHAAQFRWHGAETRTPVVEARPLSPFEMALGEALKGDDRD